MVQVPRRSFPRRRRAKQELRQREALARLSGERLGDSPRIFLMRQALDAYCDALASAKPELQRQWSKSTEVKGQLLCERSDPALLYHLAVGVAPSCLRSPIVRSLSPLRDGLETYELLRVAEAALQICAAVRRVGAFIEVLRRVELASNELRGQ